MMSNPESFLSDAPRLLRNQLCKFAHNFFLMAAGILIPVIVFSGLALNAILNFR